MSFTLGSCKCGCNKCAESQMAVAELQRCGIGSFIPAGTSGNPPRITGPMQNSLPGPFSTLFLQYKATILWESGATASQTVVYDPNYCDMNVSYVYSWPGAPDPQNQIPASYLVFPQVTPPLNPGDPTGPHHPTYSIDAVHQPIILTGATPTFVQYNWVGWDEFDSLGNFVQHHYGGEMTYELSSPFTYAQFAAITDALLDKITLMDGSLNPSKTYADNPNATTVRYMLRYPSEFPGSPTPTDAQLLPFTNAIAVSQKRDGFYFTPFAFGQIFGWIYFGNPCRSCVSYVFSGSGLPRQLALLPLAASGLPYQKTGFGTGASLVPAFPPSETSANFIYSVKSAVRNLVDVNLSAQSIIYDSNNNKFAAPAAVLLPGGIGEFLFSPNEVGGIGYLTAQYLPATAVGVQVTPYNYIHTALAGRIVVLARGQIITFYAMSADTCFTGLANVAATWTLTQLTGSSAPTDLVVAPDGKSAIYTAPRSGPAACKITAIVPGLVSTDTFGIQNFPFGG